MSRARRGLHLLPRRPRGQGARPRGAPAPHLRRRAPGGGNDAGHPRRPQGVTCFSPHRGRNAPVYRRFRSGGWPPPFERRFREPPEWIRTARTIRDFASRGAFEWFIAEGYRAEGVQARDPCTPAAPEPMASRSSRGPSLSTSS